MTFILYEYVWPFPWAKFQIQTIINIGKVVIAIFLVQNVFCSVKTEVGNYIYLNKWNRPIKPEELHFNKNIMEKDFRMSMCKI